MGEAKRKQLAAPSEPIALDTFGGRIHVEWDPAADVKDNKACIKMKLVYRSAC